jgi:hypothetical protein
MTKLHELAAARRVLSVALAMCLVATLSGSTSAATLMTWGYYIVPTSSYDAPACVSTTRVWMQEFGVSGITRFKAKFERRGPYDPGIPGTSYQTWSWRWSGPFPNDHLSYYWSAQPTFRHFVGGEYKIRAILVGIRPSFWQLDVKKKVDLVPTIGCSSDVIISP